MSATTKTLEALRGYGYSVDICERFLGFAGKFGQRKDLFGMFDLIAMKPGEGIYGIQCFTTAWTAHEAIILGERKLDALRWIQSYGHIELWGWRKLKVKRGGKAVRWTPKVKTVSIESGVLTISEIEL